MRRILANFPEAEISLVTFFINGQKVTRSLGERTMKGLVCWIFK